MAKRDATVSGARSTESKREKMRKEVEFDHNVRRGERDSQFAEDDRNIDRMEHKGADSERTYGAREEQKERRAQAAREDRMISQDMEMDRMMGGRSIDNARKTTRNIKRGASGRRTKGR